MVAGRGRKMRNGWRASSNEMVCAAREERQVSIYMFPREGTTHDRKNTPFEWRMKGSAGDREEGIFRRGIYNRSSRQRRGEGKIAGPEIIRRCYVGRRMAGVASSSKSRARARFHARDHPVLRCARVYHERIRLLENLRT